MTGQEQAQEHQYEFDTLQLHAGQEPSPGVNARAVPIYSSTSFTFNDSQHIDDMLHFKKHGFFYTRVGNPTTDVFEKRIAALEGGMAAIAVASGVAAQFLTLTSICKQGDHIVSGFSLYAGTFAQLQYSLPNLGIETTFISGNDPEDFRKAIRENTKAIYVETIGNPGFVVPDFRALSDVAHEAGIPLIVDNTFGAGGYLIKPIEHGADIVVHSATKWIGGHGTTLGGVVIDSGKFPWNNGKFPAFTTPFPPIGNIVYWDKFGPMSFAVRFRLEQMGNMGPCPNPFGSFLLLQGLETLSLRMERINSNAVELANWLKSRDDVAWVDYVGLEENEYHAVATKYFKNGFGGILTFGPKGSPTKFIDNVKLASHLANVGDSKTLVIIPAVTTHALMNDNQQKSSGVKKDAVRVSVGIEHINDIKWDFDQALKAASSSD